MNNEFPPLGIPAPQVMDRRKETPRYVPLPQETLARRQEIAKRLEAQITPLSENLRRLSEEERRAIFYKIEHDGTPSLGGTKLKAIAEPTGTITLNEYGAILDWPAGFFDQSQDEAEAILRAAAKKRKEKRGK